MGKEYVHVLGLVEPISQWVEVEKENPSQLGSDQRKQRNIGDITALTKKTRWSFSALRVTVWRKMLCGLSNGNLSCTSVIISILNRAGTIYYMKQKIIFAATPAILF